jgi:paired amphipathic helix protein Sin3a
MKAARSQCFLFFIATALSQLVILTPGGGSGATQRHLSEQQPLMNPAGPGGPALSPTKSPTSDEQQPPAQAGVMLSDVMGRDRSINIFASFTRDVESIARRLDDSTQNSTVLAPLNSEIDKLPRKPWEDPKDYDALGTNAYEGDDGQERARKNLRRFVDAHVIPASPWPKGEKVKRLVDGDREIWWEAKADKITVSMVHYLRIPWITRVP